MEAIQKICNNLNFYQCGTVNLTLSGVLFKDFRELVYSNYLLRHENNPDSIFLRAKITSE